MSHATTDIMIRGTYRMPWQILLLRGCVACRDGCMDWYIPMGPKLKDSGCVSLGQTCNNILGIAYLYRLSTSECVFVELVIDEYCTCWGSIILLVLLLIYVLCKLWIVRLGWIYAGYSCVRSVGVVEVPIFYITWLCV